MSYLAMFLVVSWPGMHFSFAHSFLEWLIGGANTTAAPKNRALKNKLAQVWKLKVYIRWILQIL